MSEGTVAERDDAAGLRHRAQAVSSGPRILVVTGPVTSRTSRRTATLRTHAERWAAVYPMTWLEP